MKMVEEIQNEVLKFLSVILSMCNFTEIERIYTRKEMMEYLIEVKDVQDFEIDKVMKILTVPKHRVLKGDYKYDLYYICADIINNCKNGIEFLDDSMLFKIFEGEADRSVKFAEFVSKISNEAMAIIADIEINGRIPQEEYFLVDGYKHLHFFQINKELSEVGVMFIMSIYDEEESSEGIYSECLFDFVKDSINGDVLINIINKYSKYKTDEIFLSILCEAISNLMLLFDEELDNRYNTLVSLIENCITVYTPHQKEEIELSLISA